MHFPPSRLEARVALEDERREVHEHQLLRRQRGRDDDDVDPLESFLSEIFGPGTTTSSTRTNTRTTATPPTPTRPTVVTPSAPSTTPRTSTTPSTTSTTPRTSAEVVTTPPPNVTRTSFSTVSTTSTSTGNVDASQANNSSSKSGLPSVVVGVIVAASIIFGLIFLALIARKIFQSRRRSRRATWARNSIIAPFEPPLQEKALPPPPMETQPIVPQQQSYPAYPPAAMSYANNLTPYSPITAAPNTPSYPNPYPFAPNAQQATSNNGFGANTFAAPDLTGPVVIQTTPPTPSTAAANSTSGPISVVKRTFVPSLPDELSISNGEQVRVVAVYDDGWALCEKLVGGERGVVPQECLDKVPQTNSNTPQQQIVPNEDTRLNRNSSLRRNQDKTY
ncbi:hypothetical protein CPB86DRAFT_134626 [Serendipita vermifera]|nr:hypothetical protein CPB86DRAFT_134626 [Serendipita vermifera]